MTIYYPSELPLPSQDDYAFTPVSPLLRSSMTTGRARQRRAYLNTPTQLSLYWLFTDSQAAAFEDWFDDTLISGSQWFVMNLRTPLGLTAQTCRFTDIFSGPQRVGANYWKYTATLELEKRYGAST